MSQIDWTFWSAMKEVKISDAAALSLDIDPDSLRWDEFEESFGQGQDFDKRLRLLQNNASDREHFPTACSLDLGHGWACGIVLREVGAWLILKGFELPEGFPRPPARATIVRTLEVPESGSIRFADLAHLMASAMWPSTGEADDRMDYGIARANLEEELKSAVKQGKLNVRNASTLARETFILGAALNRSVVLPREDLQPYLAARGGIELRLIPFGAGPAYWTLESSAGALAEQESWHRGITDALLKRMNDAAIGGALIVIDPQTLLPYRPAVVRNYWDLVRPADVNVWLQALGAPYRWNVLANLEGKNAATVGRSLDPMNDAMAGATQRPPDPSAAVRGHTVKNRSDPLAAVIELAKESAADRNDYQSVWAALAKAAQAAPRPPLIGYVPGEGIQYTSEESDEPRYFTKNALRKRMNPKARGGL